MPIYVYEHQDKVCDLGERFEVRQSINDPHMTTCPKCRQQVRRIIVRTNILKQTSDSDLKSKGFAKLVRRDAGVYENVTATDKESRYYYADKPETAPDLKKRIRD